MCGSLEDADPRTPSSSRFFGVPRGTSGFQVSVFLGSTRVCKGLWFFGFRNFGVRMETTAQSEMGAITRLVLKHARDAFVSPASIESEWRALGFTAATEFE